MTDQEQIEEMASDMDYVCTKRDLYPDDAKEIAKTLILLGYRKLDDHAIMALRKAKGIENKIRKETAEKIYLQAKAIVDATKHIVQGREYIHIDALKEIIKNCGVEIKE